MYDVKVSFLLRLLNFIFNILWYLYLLARIIQTSLPYLSNLVFCVYFVTFLFVFSIVWIRFMYYSTYGTGVFILLLGLQLPRHNIHFDLVGVGTKRTSCIRDNGFFLVFIKRLLVEFLKSVLISSRNAGIRSLP